jgi:hypothetical protein
MNYEHLQQEPMRFTVYASSKGYTTLERNVRTSMEALKLESQMQDMGFESKIVCWVD